MNNSQITVLRLDKAQQGWGSWSLGLALFFPPGLFFGFGFWFMIQGLVLSTLVWAHFWLLLHIQLKAEESKTLQNIGWCEGVAVVWGRVGPVDSCLMEETHTWGYDPLPADLSACCPLLPLQLRSSPD